MGIQSRAPSFFRPPAIWTPWDCYAECVASANSAPAEGGWSANNQARYVPVVFPVDCTLFALYFRAANGTGNYDLGLYDYTLAKIASTGSTAMTAAGRKTLSLSEYRVQAGLIYYAALALSSTSGNSLRFAPSLNAMNHQIGQEASALPLPANATPVTPTSAGTIPVFAFAIR